LTFCIFFDSISWTIILQKAGKAMFILTNSLFESLKAYIEDIQEDLAQPKLLTVRGAALVGEDLEVEIYPLYSPGGGEAYRRMDEIREYCDRVNTRSALFCQRIQVDLAPFTETGAPNR
jgi:hypothetical protein